MRISELSQQANMPVATVKYYLRERLLPAGERTSATQAIYSEAHLRRLRLIRVLVETAGLTLSQVRAVLSGLEQTNLLDAAATVHDALVPDLSEVDKAPALELLDSLGWQYEDSPAVAELAVALQAASSVGMSMRPEWAKVYADAAKQVARSDIESVPTDSVEAAVQHIVLGTVLFEPILLALRRVAQQEVAVSMWLEPPT